MKRFKFRLQRVLQHRETVRDERRRELLESQRKVTTIEDRLGMLEAAEQGNGLAAEGAIPYAAVTLQAMFGHRVRDEIAKSRDELEKARGELEEVLARYVESSRDVKSLEMLKAKKLEQHTEAAFKHEQNLMDESSSLRHAFERASDRRELEFSEED